MTPRSNTSVLIGLAVLATLAYLVWSLSSILLPFIVAFAVAYLLNPVVDQISARVPGVRTRRRASLFILAAFFGLLLIVASITLPFLVREMLLLASALPDSIDALWLKITDLATRYGFYSRAMDTIGLADLLKSTLAPTLRTGAEMLTALITQGQNAVSTLVTVFLVPVLAYFIMCEWPRLIQSIDDLYPRPYAETYRTLVRDMDARVSGFVRGQIIVCAILATYYVTALWVAGLPYALMIGLMGGILTIIPFVGITTTLIIALSVASFQVSDMGWGIVWATLSVFAIGQIVEGNLITPKIVGHRVGLHPIAIIFALMVGGYSFGIVGMMVAIPTAAALSVLIEFWIKRYKASTLYHGGHLPNPNEDCHPRVGGDPVK